jgi:hypothetical protein
VKGSEGPTEPYPNELGRYSFCAGIAYGMLIADDFGGYVHAFDLKTGKKLWSYYSGDAGYNTPYGIYTQESPMFIADGKIYVSQGHGYSPPLFKGARLYCLNASDGNLIWEIYSFNDRTGYAVADGYIVVYNNYDGRIYCFGKGPTATTVTASSKVLALGNSVMIEGRVIDISTGANQDEQTKRFPNGLPAVSDESMRAWMEYVYMQQPIPTDVKGVELTLDAIDQNGKCIHIGRVTTDTSGMFSCLWAPTSEGTYTIIVTFEWKTRLTSIF